VQNSVGAVGRAGEIHSRFEIARRWASFQGVVSGVSVRQRSTFVESDGDFILGFHEKSVPIVKFSYSRLDERMVGYFETRQ